MRVTDVVNAWIFAHWQAKEEANRL